MYIYKIIEFLMLQINELVATYITYNQLNCGLSVRFGFKTTI